jgi:hypothetical protein
MNVASNRAPARRHALSEAGYDELRAAGPAPLDLRRMKIIIFPSKN